MVWLRRSFRALGVLLAVLMIATFMIPCGPVRASDGEITVNVRIEGYRDSNYPDGTILPTRQVSLPAGSTALDALIRAAAEYDLDVESNGFVTSIGGQASGHFGGWDGWMYRVNGYSPNVGAASYVLQEGDTVLWYYGDWAGTQYPDVYQFTEKDGYLNVELSSDSSPITGVSLSVYSSVDASVYSRVYDTGDGTYTVVFADDQGNPLPPGEYTLRAEKFREDGFPEMVKPEPVTINVVEQDPTPPNEPSITSAVPRGSQGIEVSGSADPGAQVVVTAVDSSGKEAVASKPVFADASGRFKAYLDIAEGGTYTLTATATKLEVKVEASGAISESSLPSAVSQTFLLDVVEKPEILSAEYDPNTDSIIVELSRISDDGASIIVTLSIFGMDDLTQEVQTKPDATSYEVAFANLGIQAGGTYYCTVTAKAVLEDKESIEDTYFFSFSTAEVEEANLAEKAGAYIYSSYLLNGVTKGDNAVGSYALFVLKQAGVNVSIWERDDICLDDAVLQAISQDAGEPTGVSAKQLAQDVLAAQKLGKSDLVQQLLGVLRGRHSESGFDGNIYSDVAAYELLGRAGYLSAVLDTVEAKVYARDYILGAQDTDPESETYGSFGSVWGETFYPDFMTTAQAVRALHYLDPQGEDKQVQEAIQAGLNWMRAQQQEDGSFAASDWDDPLIDTVEAIATLDVLEIEPTTWAHESTGKTPVDYMEEGALNEDGSFGSSRNVMDAVWALYGYHLLGLPVEKQLTISPSIMSLEVGSKGEYTLKFHDAEGESDVTSEASWSVGNPSIAGIDGGQVTALSVGQTTVTAVYGGLTVTATLKVEAAEGPGGGAASPSTCTVGVAVVGKNGELLFGPGYVLLSKEGRWGLTALGALDATGLPYRLSDKWEGFVEEIAGQAGSGMEGWCYTVNGVMPMTSADKYQVEDGDKVIWYYSKSMDQQPPKWEDLVKQQATGAIPAAEALKSVESTLSELQSGKVSAGQAVSRLAETLEKLKESEVTEELKSKLSEAARLLAVALAKVPDKALTSQEEGEKVTIKIDGEILK
ncbi:MAG: Amylopullulanase AmyB, partial [Thermoanaerobacterales bacterium 50_218]